MNKYLFRYINGIYSTKIEIYANTFMEACYQAGFTGKDKFILLNTEYCIPVYVYNVKCDDESIVIYSEKRLIEKEVKEKAKEKLGHGFIEMTYTSEFFDSPLKQRKLLGRK